MKQNNNWMGRLTVIIENLYVLQGFSIARWKGGKELKEVKIICDFVEKEIDKAVEEALGKRNKELQAIIDKNTVDGCYSPDGISQDLIMFVGAEVIKKKLNFNQGGQHK